MLIGMSQEKLGEMLSLTFQQVQKYEKGVNRIGAGRLYDVSRILGVPIDYFYEGISTPAGQCRGRWRAAGDGIRLGPAKACNSAWPFMKIKDSKVRKRVLDLCEKPGGRRSREGCGVLGASARKSARRVSVRPRDQNRDFAGRFFPEDLTGPHALSARRQTSSGVTPAAAHSVSR